MVKKAYYRPSYGEFQGTSKISVRFHHLLMTFVLVESVLIKGILHPKNFYRLNLIFWIVMGCGIARFGRRGLKTTEN